MASKIRVLLADDHAIFRAGVRLLLEAESDIKVVGEALNGDEAMSLTESLHPDVILMDVAMPGMNGLEGTRMIKARFPAVHVVALTMHRSDDYFLEMLKAGASGYVLKGASTTELVDAVRKVSKGHAFLHPSMTGQLLQDYKSRLQEEESDDRPVLTPREREILLLLAEGYSTGEIAERLRVSSSTVHSHRTNLMRKLNLSSRRDLFQYARRQGLLKDP